MITALVLYDLPPHIDREACRQHFLKIAPDFSACLVSFVSSSSTT